MCFLKCNYGQISQKKRPETQICDSRNPKEMKKVGENSASDVVVRDVKSFKATNGAASSRVLDGPKRLTGVDLLVMRGGPTAGLVAVKGLIR